MTSSGSVTVAKIEEHEKFALLSFHLGILTSPQADVFESSVQEGHHAVLMLVS
jgi:hypothetical protein